MTHKNLGAKDYQYILNWASDAYSANPLYALLIGGGSLTETWGNAYAAGTMGWQASGHNKYEGSNNTDSFTSPWGSYTRTPASGLTYGYLRVYVAGAILTVNPDCTWTYRFTSLTVYESVGGGAETTVFSTGAQSMSGSDYDERLNVTALGPNLETTPLDFTLECTSTPGSWSNAATAGGGYEWGAPGSLAPDSILIDGAAGSGSCACSAAVPTYSALNSYEVSTSATVTGSIVQGSTTTQGCAGCGPEYTWWVANSSLVTGATSCGIKAENVPVGEQTLASSWSCAPYSGSSTSGSTTATTSPSLTTCESTRTVSTTSQERGCFTPEEISLGCTAPCWPTTPYAICTYSATVSLSWPMLPPCVPSTVELLGYDVSNGFRHAITYRNADTGDIWLACAGNVLPQTWSAVDTGLAATWARPRFADMGATWPIGLFYGDGSNCFWARTYDEGNTWLDTIAMGTGMIGDFDEGANGLRWLFKVDSPDGGTTYAVYNRLLDAQLNVVRDWAETNVTGIDNAPIACRESPASDGSWRIGLLYSLAGVETIQFSPDGLTFS